jgi:hypothetical protein
MDIDPLGFDIIRRVYSRNQEVRDFNEQHMIYGVCVCVYRLHGSTHYTLYTACIDTAILLIGVGERDTGEAASG